MDSDFILNRIRYLSKKIDSDSKDPSKEGIDIDEALELVKLIIHLDNKIMSGECLPIDWE